MSPVTETVPAYVERLLDIITRPAPITTAAFEGVDVPQGVIDRLDEFQEARDRLAEERSVDFTDAHMLLVSKIAYAVASEFERSLGIKLGASRDDTWLKAGDGIAFKTGLQHVGWYHEEGERAHMFVRSDLYPTPPDDGRDWHPVYAIV
jgi:hypothetical protein